MLDFGSSLSCTVCAPHQNFSGCERLSTILPTQFHFTTDLNLFSLMFTDKDCSTCSTQYFAQSECVQFLIQIYFSNAPVVGLGPQLQTCSHVPHLSNRRK